MEGGDLEGLAAADVLAGELVVAADHVGLGLGEAGSVALVGVARELGALAADDPGDFILGRLAAFGTGEVVGALLGGFVEKIAFFHDDCSEKGRGVGETSAGRQTTPYSTLRRGERKVRVEMAKRKKDEFSAAKAVKANARERVGQPKPARVVQDEPRTGRKVKHKPTLEKVIEQGE